MTNPSVFRADITRFKSSVPANYTGKPCQALTGKNACRLMGLFSIGLLPRDLVRPAGTGRITKRGCDIIKAQISFKRRA